MFGMVGYLFRNLKRERKKRVITHTHTHTGGKYFITVLLDYKYFEICCTEERRLYMYVYKSLKFRYTGLHLYSMLLLFFSK
jgi:hypothetical protein